MSGPLWRAGIVTLGAMLLLVSASPAFAADVQQGQTVTIGPEQVINDDLYAFGSNVQILGTVNGDVFTAGNTVTIGGTVTGGVFAAGNSVLITGTVQQGVHAAGGTVTLSGPVAQDAVIAGGSYSMLGGASVGRDMLFAGGTGELKAPIERNLLAAASQLTLADIVGGDVRARAGTLQLTDAARVDGSLTYTSDVEAQIAPGASVGGDIQHVLPPERSEPAPPIVNPAWAVLDWVRGLVGLAVVGLLLTLLFPGFAARTVHVAKTSYWSSLGSGFALFIGVPVAAFAVFILGIFLGGWMLGIALLALYAMACAVGFTVVAIVAGNLVVQLMRQPPQHLAWNLLEGLALFGLIGLVPVMGGMLLLLAGIYGLGALALGVFGAYRGTRAAPVGLEMAASPPEQPPRLAAA
jgi:hypothetical protein